MAFKKSGVQTETLNIGKTSPILQFPLDCIISTFHSSLNMFPALFHLAALEGSLFPWQDYPGKLHFHIFYCSVLRWCLDVRLLIIYSCENSREMKQMKGNSILILLDTSSDI